MTGFAAVAAAADRAMREKGPDPVERFPRRWGTVDEPCPELERESNDLLDDPITIFYGIGSEMLPSLERSHVARHGCQGWGRP